MEAMAPSSAANVRNPRAYGCPFGQIGPSIYIYHPVFSEFDRDMETRIEDLPSEFRVKAYQFVNLMTKEYEEKNERSGMIKKHLSLLFGEMIHDITWPSGNRTYQFSSILTATGKNHMAMRLLIDIKEVRMLGWLDPTAQSCYTLSKYWTSDEVRTIFIPSGGI
jgi:hypothetical protein